MNEISLKAMTALGEMREGTAATIAGSAAEDAIAKAKAGGKGAPAKLTAPE